MANAMALVAESALRGYMSPLLAADQSINLKPICAKLTGKKWKSQKAGVKIALDAVIARKPALLAKDASIADVTELLDNLDDVAKEVAEELESGDATATGDKDDDVDPAAMDDDGDAAGRLREFLKSKGMEDADVDAACKMLKPEMDMSMDEFPNETDAEKKKRLAKEATDKVANDAAKAAKDKLDKDGKPMVTAAAMDAAIARGAAAATATLRRQLTDAAAAREAVRPFVGDVPLAMDRAGDIYKLAFDAAEVDVTDVPVSAFPTMLKLLTPPGEANKTQSTASAKRPQFAEDASPDNLEKAFPGATRLKMR